MSSSTLLPFDQRRSSFATFGEWLAAWPYADAIGDLRDDMATDLRVQLQKPSSYFITPSVLHTRMLMASACPEAIDALRRAAAIYGEPLPAEDDDEDDELVLTGFFDDEQPTHPRAPSLALRVEDIAAAYVQLGRAVQVAATAVSHAKDDIDDNLWRRYVRQLQQVENARVELYEAIALHGFKFSNGTVVHVNRNTGSVCTSNDFDLED